ncbi:hypothetical protein ACFE04_006594 [Oxalis oulophora]
MLCPCSSSVEELKMDEIPESPQSLATRDFSASGVSSSRTTTTTTTNWESSCKLNDSHQVDEAESTLKEALSLNYEEARALLGRLEYQRGNYHAALQVFQGIDIKGLSPRMSLAILHRTTTTSTAQPTTRNAKAKSLSRLVVPSTVMYLHSVSLFLEAILLKAKSLAHLHLFKEAAKECKVILDIVESAKPHGMPQGIGEVCKMLEMFHKALELLPKLWIKAGCLDEAIAAYRRALVRPWNLDPVRLASIQKELAATLLYGGVETSIPPHLQMWGPTTPRSNTEEAILLLVILMKKVACGEILWDEEIMEHLGYALSVSEQFELLANHVELALPGTYNRAERWYLLALCYSAAGQNDVALNLLKKIAGPSEAKHKPHIPSFLLAAKLCSQDPNHSHDGIKFARKILDLTNNNHFTIEVHKFLGICYGNAARISIVDSERAFLQKESITFLNSASLKGRDDPDVIFSQGLENAVQRNLDVAFNYAMMYSDMVAGSSTKGYKLLTTIASAQQRFKDAETIIEFALHESGKKDQLEILRLKAVLQIAQEQPKQAIETYRLLLTLMQSHREQQDINFDREAIIKDRDLEIAAWQDLAKIYTDLGVWPDAKICVEKAKSIEFFSPSGWHATGILFEAQSLHKEAQISFLNTLSIEPDYVPSMVSVAEVLMKCSSESLPIARSFLMNALRLEPTNHQAWMNLGLISKREGSLQQAADFFQAAAELKLSAPVESFV